MDPLTRRSFVSQAAAGLAALGMAAEAPREVHAQLVWKGAQWKLAEFHKLVENPASVKQVVNVSAIGGGKFLNGIKNSLNGLCYGFDVPKESIKIVAALHGAANMVNYDDAVWSKYEIGEWLEVSDPETGKPAVRNIFYPSKHPLDAASYAKDPSDRDSVYQDMSVQALQARGVQFLSCHTATEEQARGLIEHKKLTQSPEEVVSDMLAHTLPGVLVVASMVAAIALLQVHGHYSYLNS
ncbi:MAG: twin-arginine translocation signal domain-containing protein [Terracidiphilus sp.]